MTEFLGLVSEIYSAEIKLIKLKLLWEILILHTAKYIDWYIHDDSALIIDKYGIFECKGDSNPKVDIQPI